MLLSQADAISYAGIYEQIQFFLFSLQTMEKMALCYIFFFI